MSLLSTLYIKDLGVPVAFLSGDEALTKEVQRLIKHKSCCNKIGAHGATISKHLMLQTVKLKGSKTSVTRRFKSKRSNYLKIR